MPAFNVNSFWETVEKMDPVSGSDWYGGTTIWGVRYEYADAKGGGEATDFFRTPTRYIPPIGPQIGQLLGEQGQITVVGVLKIELLYTITPGDECQLTAHDLGESKHRVIFDAFAGGPNDYFLEFEDVE